MSTTTEYKIAIMEAYTKGATIEAKDRINVGGGLSWTSINLPVWNWHQRKYRIQEKRQRASKLDRIKAILEEL